MTDMTETEQLFYDMPVQDKAAYAPNEVREVIRKILMEKGIVEVEDPGEFTIPKPKVKMVTYYRVGYGMSVLVKSPKIAEKFFDLEPMHQTDDWNIGYAFKFAKKEDKRIELCELYDEEDLKLHAPEMQEWEAQHNRWSAKKNEYDTYINNKNHVSKTVIDNWKKACEQNDAIAKVKETYDEYMKILDNDHEKAMVFLRKAFTEEQITQAKITPME
jgi:hypothetical protein